MVRPTLLIVAAIVLGACSANQSSEEPADAGEVCQATVHVFLRTDATAPRQRRVGQIIDGAPGVVDSRFHSAADAYREFKKTYKDQPELYETRKPSDFGSRYEVTLESSQVMSTFEARMKSTTGIDGVVPGGCATESPAS